MVTTPLKTAYPAVWALLERLAARCHCLEHSPRAAGCPGDDCDGCASCPSGRARAIMVLEEDRPEDLETLLLHLVRMLDPRDAADVALLDSDALARARALLERRGRLSSSRIVERPAMHHPGTDRKGHPVTECARRGCRR